MWADDTYMSCPFMLRYGLMRSDGRRLSECIRPVSYTHLDVYKRQVEAFGLYSETAVCGFDDIDENAWYYRYVASGVSAGVISGISENRFGTGELITRQDMAAIIARLIVYRGGELAAGDRSFDDGDEIADYAKDAVESLCKMGILSGVGDNRFAPRENATRAQAAVMLNLARK